MKDQTPCLRYRFRLRTATEPIQTFQSRAKKRMNQLEIAREIVALEPEDRLRVWQEKTGGASRATMYRRLRELAQADAAEFES